ncbi:MAG: hypothetical protein ACTSRB_16240, partial [Candidatus Helarchaeota archaeon]
QLEPADFLSYEDQFFATKSFVEGLIHRGIQSCLVDSLKREMETGIMPIDLDNLMRMQLIHAILDVAPDACTELLKFMLECFYVKDPERYRIIFLNDLSEETYNPIWKKTKKIILHEELSDHLIQTLLNDDAINEILLDRYGLPKKYLKMLFARKYPSKTPEEEIMNITKYLDRGHGVSVDEINPYTRKIKKTIQKILNDLIEKKLMVKCWNGKVKLVEPCLPKQACY